MCVGSLGIYFQVVGKSRRTFSGTLRGITLGKLFARIAPRVGFRYSGRSDRWECSGDAGPLFSDSNTDGSLGILLGGVTSVFGDYRSGGSRIDWYTRAFN